VYSVLGSTVSGPTLRYDLNADGDFADADEQLTLAPSGSGPIAIGRDGSGEASVATRNTVYADPTP
jgi:hypothetical protein